MINKKRFREMGLRLAGEERPAWKVKAVASDLYVEAEVMLRAWLRRRIQTAPSRGKTLR